VTQDYWDNNQLKFVETSDRTTSPYFEVGVGMLSPWSKRLSVNLNYNYQIANDDIDISSFSLSGNYTF
jgi:outer membrane autotransporter protein